MKVSSEYKNEIHTEFPIHLPDKKFVDWCLENFSINRGVFNVIDNWFFDYGIQHIVRRRRIIIQYLDHLQTYDHIKVKRKRPQFGKGGVKQSLYYFVAKCQNINNSQNNKGEGRCCGSQS
ncbi:hypothetical protein ACTWQL_22675 [Pseudalkalibacillus sp. R45]|uniref:hypothetical protein n=1 Tax=Pseudalkalibacillus sp. R45 TaxID=3457433 RepID=UPI003FCE290C